MCLTRDRSTLPDTYHNTRNWIEGFCSVSTGVPTPVDPGPSSHRLGFPFPIRTSFCSVKCDLTTASHVQAKTLPTDVQPKPFTTTVQGTDTDTVYVAVPLIFRNIRLVHRHGCPQQDENTPAHLGNASPRSSQQLDLTPPLMSIAHHPRDTEHGVMLCCVRYTGRRAGFMRIDSPCRMPSALRYASCCSRKNTSRALGWAMESTQGSPQLGGQKPFPGKLQSQFQGLSETNVPDYSQYLEACAARAKASPQVPPPVKPHPYPGRLAIYCESRLHALV
ncbi:hypothetical protein Cob_v008244 [Colletotrichum orbiculare MAFF 240422]|uniref:Uncharacterized protein n=1 Tax=Colletotrichum orbiculare (strain 104-T / ATCC 96160 / CBS 514.97 / LARS 414 / MAFF 240422) TaxID=1213857 RepID=A0A484FMI2_COLOR|nr:hypothetical protein Cob_v008244 [Colletotrichum orbiculare MAFF 240422]